MFDFEYLSEEENATLSKLAKSMLKGHEGPSIERRGSPWASDMNVLVYVDDMGADCAYAEGADIVINENLNKEESAQLHKDGFVIKEGAIYAWGTFLMERFVEFILYRKSKIHEEKSLHNILKRMSEGYDKTIDSTSEEVGPTKLPSPDRLN